MEKQIRVMLACKESNFGEKCARFLINSGYRVTTVEKDGALVVRHVLNNPPDVLVIDAFMPGLDALGVLAKLNASNCSTLVIVTSSVDNSYFEKEVLRNGARYYLLKPFEPAVLAKRIEQITTWYHKPEKRKTTDNDLEIVISNVMRQIGVPAHIKGYHYLRLAILLAVRDPYILHAVTKELYPSIAKQNETTSPRVERAIRHAIELAWDRGDVDVLDSYFGCTVQPSKGKPTNSEFIAAVSDKIRLSNK